LSEQLLIEVDKLLLDQNITKSDLEAIIGHVGPGSYTGVRIGITTANFLAFSLDIPVFGINKEKLSKQDLLEIKKKIELSDRFTLPILPVYNALPFITKARL
jgi:tRNA A37 threonylcarbamoyladenosine modification protein TsaB